jgi:PleD family two-component response regulator
MTFGVASSEKFSTVKDIILKADENLYQGKRSGKNCVVIFVGGQNGKR